MKIYWPFGRKGSSPFGGTINNIYMKFILRQKKLCFKIEADKYNTHIENSYRVKSKDDMSKILKAIRNRCVGDYAIHKRTIKSMINEWRSHNLLYNIGIYKDRTASVDLDINSKWYISMAYSILSFLYFKK